MKFTKLYFYLLAIRLSHGVLLQKCNKTIKDRLCFKGDSYNKNVIPKPLPCKIQPSLFMRDVFNIDDEKDTITMSLEVTIAWFDTRLDFLPSHE